MNKRVLAVICVICLCVSCMGMVTGCGNKKLTDAEYEELAKENAEANSKKVVLKITKGDKTYDVTLDMFTYYLAYNESEGIDSFNSKIDYYKSVYGENVNFWGITATEGQTMGQVYKEYAYASMLYTLLMYYEAQDVGLSLTEERKNALDAYTQQFLDKYTAEQRARCGMTAEVIRANYERIFLAQQFSSIATSNLTVDREAVAATIDKEQYRYYKTNYLYLTKSDDDEEIAKKAGSTEQRLSLMNSCLEKIKSGATLEEVKAEHNEILVLNNNDFRLAETNGLDSNYITAVMNMKVGETKLLDFSYGIFIVQLVDNTTFYGYEDAVTAAVEQEMEKGVKGIYEGIEAKYSIKKTEEWDSIKMGNILNAPKK